MKRVFSAIILINISLMILACDDVFEEDISNDLISVIYPKNNETIAGNSVEFKWNNLSGAEDYRLQVTNSISNQLIIDSLVSQNRLALPLVSGAYNWRIRGENFAYQTGYNFPESFVVEATNDLSTQSVFLSSPSDNFYTRNNTIILTWLEVDAATSYKIQIDKIVNGNSSTIFQESDLTETSYTLDATILSEDANYKWMIRAVNENSQTEFFSRNIFLDTENPNQPILISPNNNDTQSLTVDFSWNLGQDIGVVQSPIRSLLEIASNQNFSTIIQSYSVASNSQQHVFAETGQYYWRVKIIDEAGNEGVYSESRLLTVE